MATGGAVAVMLIRAGMNPWLALVFAFLAGMAAGFVTGMLHTALWNSGHSCQYSDTDLALLDQSEYFGKLQSGRQC